VGLIVLEYSNRADGSFRFFLNYENVVSSGACPFAPLFAAYRSTNAKQTSFLRGALQNTQEHHGNDRQPRTFPVTGRTVTIDFQRRLGARSSLR
jgi:hypothetical protein